MIVPFTFHIKTKLCKLKESRLMKGKPNVGELLSSESISSQCVYMYTHTMVDIMYQSTWLYNYTNFIKIKFTYDGRDESRDINVYVSDESQSDCYLS